MNFSSMSFSILFRTTSLKSDRNGSWRITPKYSMLWLTRTLSTNSGTTPSVSSVHTLPPFKSDSFVHLKGSIVKGLVKRADLAIHKFELWKNLIRWAIANTDRKIVDEPSNWSKEDRDAVRVMLEGFIPHVRFY